MVEAGTRQVFHADGGTIGRRPDSTWVLPDSAVSSVHARITCRDGVFSVTDDHSTNGVFVNSEQELERGVSHELRSGDTVYIGPYEIGVTIPSSESRDDPFASASLHVPAPARRPALEPADGPQPLAELDPLKALELEPKPELADPVRPVPEESHLHARSPLEDHYRPRVPRAPTPPPPAPVPPPATPPLIPDDYDPLASDAQSDDDVDAMSGEAGLDDARLDDAGVGEGLDDEIDPFGEHVSERPAAVERPLPVTPAPREPVKEPAPMRRPEPGRRGDDEGRWRRCWKARGYLVRWSRQTLPGALVESSESSLRG